MRRLALLLVTLALPCLLLAVTLLLLASGPFLRWEYGRHGFPAAPGFSAAERLAVAVPSALFIVRPMDRAVLEGLQQGGAPLYTAAEIDHLVDVKRLVALIIGLGVADAVLVGAAALAWRKGRLPGLPRALEWGGWLGVALVVGVAVGIALAWPAVFTGFHELLFPPGTWQFPADSGLIRLFPGQFWYDTATALAGLVALEAIWVILLGRRLRRHTP